MDKAFVEETMRDDCVKENSEAQDYEEAFRLLSPNFHKILKVNLTRDTHRDIRVYSEEKSKRVGFSPSFSDWLTDFALTGNVYEEDRDEYLAFTNADALKKHFRESSEPLRCRYRRRVGQTFRWVCMEILPSLEYTPQNQVVILYIRDIHEEYTAELKRREELERCCRTDALTGLENRYSYNDHCRALEGRTDAACSVGVLFADINGLKYINDHYGHSAGDEYLKSFAAELVREFGDHIFRISGDEFVVLAVNGERSAFLSRVERLRSLLGAGREFPWASIGCAWTEELQSVETLVRQAEAAMYEDKRGYYSKYPKYRR